jgi:hypothetical protein
LAIHNANLQLARIPVDMIGKPHAVRFNVLFSFDTKSQSFSVPWNWREMEFEPVEAAPQTQPKPADATDQQLPQLNIAATAPIKSGKRAKVVSLFRKNKPLDPPTAASSSQNSTE